MGTDFDMYAHRRNILKQYAKEHNVSMWQLSAYAGYKFDTNFARVTRTLTEKQLDNYRHMVDKIAADSW